MHVTWGVIPVAGRGTRMYPLSQAIPKELLPLGTKPVLQRVIEELASAGIRDLVFVTSQSKPAIREFLQADAFWRDALTRLGIEPVRIHLVDQPRQSGLGDAVLQAKSLVEGPFVIALGDCVIGGPGPCSLMSRVLKQFSAPGADAAIALEQVPANEIDKYGIAQVEGTEAELRVVDLVEKPPPGSTPSRWAIAGRYAFPPVLFQWLEQTERGRGGEIQLTDAIRAMIRAGHSVVGTALRPDERRYDVGEFEPYFEAFAEYARVDRDRHPEHQRAPRRDSAKAASSSVGHAYARAGLLGNPSDGYGGKTISLILRNWRADVRLMPSSRLRFRAGAAETEDFSSVAEFVSSVRKNGYYGGLRLVQAAVKRFYEFFGDQLPSTAACFAAEYSSSIPRQLGLGGSSAIVVATLRALARFYNIAIPSEWLPSLALSVETDELGIPAGLQDRVIQTYEGLMFMDFSPAHRAEWRGLARGDYHRLDEGLLPPLYVAVQESAAEPTEVIHSDLRKRFDRGDTQVVSAMTTFAQIAERGRQALLDRHSPDLAELIDANFDLRRSICKILPEHLKMVTTARSVGASAKFCGSGGAIIGTYRDDAMLAALNRAMSTIGARVVRPQVLPSPHPVSQCT
jgi:glucuronokinase